MNTSLENTFDPNNVHSSRSIKKLLKKKFFIVGIALLLTGLGASITSISFKTGIYFINNWKLELLNNFPSYLVLPLIGCFGGYISGSLIKNFAPAAKGSGVSQIMGFLRHKKVPMNIKVGMVKLISGIIAIGSGFPLGPEGPSVQMGGSVAWQMAKWLKAPVSFRRVIVAAGGGAGIAAVFSAPLGGFIYAIEELLNCQTASELKTKFNQSELYFSEAGVEESESPFEDFDSLGEAEKNDFWDFRFGG